MTINEYNMELQKMVSFKSVGFGFLSITVVLIISFLHYLEIKRVLHNRKVIWYVCTKYPKKLMNFFSFTLIINTFPLESPNIYNARKSTVVVIY
jgi:hypothetical protein